MIKLKNILDEYGAMNKMSDYKDKERPLEESSWPTGQELSDFVKSFKEWWKDEGKKEPSFKGQDMKTALKKTLNDPKKQKEFKKKHVEPNKDKSKEDKIQKMANAKLKSDIEKEKKKATKAPKVKKKKSSKGGDAVMIRNPKTGRNIKATSALKKGHPAYKDAIEKLKKRRKEVKESINEGVPFPTSEPNMFAYMDFKKWVKRNERTIHKDLKNYPDTSIFKRMEYWWTKWDKNANDGAFSNIKGNKFGRELILMLRKDKLLFSPAGNKISRLKRG